MALSAAFPDEFGILGIIGLVMGMIMSLFSPYKGLLILICLYYWPVVLYGGPFSSIPFAVILTACILVGILFQNIRGKLQISLFKFEYLILFVLIAYLILSLLFAKSFSSGMKYFEWGIRGITLFFFVTILITKLPELIFFVKSYAVIGFITFLISVAHYIGGYSAQWVQIKLQSDVIDIYDRIIYFGTEPNYLAIILVPSAALALVIYSISQKKYQRLLWGGIFLGITFGVLGTYSRGGMISLFILIFSYSVFDRKTIKFFIPIILLSAMTAILLNPEVLERIYSIYDSIVYEGATDRFYYWGIALSLWYENLASLFVGLGIGGYIYKVGEAVHNTPLAILVDLGVVGLFLYAIVPVWVTINTLMRMKKEKGSPLNKIRGGILLGCFAVFVGYNTISDISLFTFYILLGLAFTTISLGSQQKHRARPNILRYVHSV